MNELMNELKEKIIDNVNFMKEKKAKGKKKKKITVDVMIRYCAIMYVTWGKKFKS